jgi:predicted NUDIX family NTP pyrophosphohydrolase
VQPGEEWLQRAWIEFEEELAFHPAGECRPLGSITQRGGKTVHAWAIQGNLPPDFTLRSHTFAMEWPPRSGRMCEFPEVDRAEFFSLATARRMINPAQAALLDRLAEIAG